MKVREPNLRCSPAKSSLVANGANQKILDALTPEIAILATGDPSRTRGQMSAFSFDHPRATIIDQVLGALSRRRTPVEVQVATGAKEFENITLREAVYATGWDGTVVITAKGRRHVSGRDSSIAFAMVACGGRLARECVSG